MATAIAEKDEPIDVLSRRLYGDESVYTEAILAENPGLASLGPFLPFGTVVQLPDIDPPAEEAPLTALWD